MISTAVMILTGHVQGNKMVDMQLTNKKLVRPWYEDDNGEDRHHRLRQSQGLAFEIRTVRKAVAAYERNSKIQIDSMGNKASHYTARFKFYNKDVENWLMKTII